MFQVRLKDLRESQGLSQAKLAKLIGVSQSTVGMWESGRNCPEHAYLSMLADFFGVSVDYLLGRSDEKKPATRESDEPNPNEIVVRSRNGQIIKKSYTDQQMRFILKLIDSIDDEDLDL